jgi:acyl-CoA thioester hydrolase
VSGGEHCVEFRVRYSETDRMGVVYHPNYLVWCEIGRTELMRSLGAAYSRLEEDGILLAVADASVRYAAAARYDDVIRVVTSIERVQSRSVTFAYRIERLEPGPISVLATASTRLLCVDGNFIPRTLPREVRALFDTGR